MLIVALQYFEGFKGPKPAEGEAADVVEQLEVEKLKITDA